MAASTTLAYTMVVEVFLQSAVVRGTLVTNQDRLSSHLATRQGDEVFALTDAELQLPVHEPLQAASREYLLYMQEVFLIADLSAADPRRRILPGTFVKKEPSKALLGVGPYLLQGIVHIQEGHALQELLVNQSRFLPITDATMTGRPDLGPRTYLVNRTRIGFLSALGQEQVPL